MKEKNAPLVLVLARNYSTGLSVIRSLGAAGYTVDLIASAYKKGDSSIAACSKYVRKSVEVVSQKMKDSKDTKLLDEILKYVGTEEKIVIFPTDDYTASVMDAHRGVLSEHFIMPSIVSGEEGSLIASMDKTFQGVLAKKVGLLTPLEWIFNLEEELMIPDDMAYPCFCKPIESISGYKREMAVCSNKDELYKHLSGLKKKYSRRSILVQEFLDIDYEIDLSGVCLDQEIIVPAIIKKTSVAQYERGVTLAGKLVPFDEIGEIKEKIINMLKEFHYFGMFDMEFNVVGDKIYFNEVNFRSGGPNYSYFASGVNLPSLFVKEALGERHMPEEERVTAYEKTFIYEKVAWEDYIHGFMTKKELKERIDTADIKLLCNDDDPAPGRKFLVRIRLSAYKRKWTNLKSKLSRCEARFKKHLKSLLRKTKYTLLGYPQMKKENQRNPESDRPRVLVAGRNYCSNLCMAKSLGEAGYEVEVLRIFVRKPKIWDLMKNLKPDAYSKYVKSYRVCVTNRKDRRIVKRLKEMAEPDRKMLLIPCDDLVTSVVDSHYDELCQYYHLPNVDGKQGEINRLMSKGVQKELALAAGLPVLNSCVIKTRKGKFRIPDSVTYPCFVKPNISKNSSKSRMRKCESREELRRTLKEFSKKKDIEMLVEDYIEIDKEYSLLGVSAKNVVLGPGFFRAEEGGHAERRGVAMIGKLLPCAEYQELINSLNQFVATLNFEGLFDIDLIETTDGKMYFVELNLRFGASGYAVTQSGVNLPGMYADYTFFGKPIDKTCVLKEDGKRFISEKIMIDEYIKRFISMSELKEKMKSTEIHFIKDNEDVRPYRHFKRYYKIAAFFRLAYYLKELIVELKLIMRRFIGTIKRRVVSPLMKIKYWILGYPQMKKENKRNTESEKPRVLVAGRNYCSNLCMARSLGEAGYEVEVLRVFTQRPKRFDIIKWMKPDAYSKYVKAFYICVTNRDDAVLVKRLRRLADKERKMLLIPADDLTASIVDSNYRRLSKYYYLPNVDDKQGRINRLMSKGAQKSLAIEAGLPVLNSCVIKTKNGKFEIPETVTYPCFIKPNISKNSSKSRMRKCETEEELRSALRSFSRKKDIEMLVEDFIEIGKEYSLLGVSTKEGVLGPGFFCAEEGGHAERRGVAMIGRLLPCSEYQELIDSLNRFVASINYEGLFDIDLIETTDGNLYFVELNLRFGASGYAVTQSGVNLPGMYADYVFFNRPVDLACTIQDPGKRFISEKVMIDEYMNHFITMDELEQKMSDVDIHFIKNDNDEKPYQHFEKFYAIAKWKRNHNKKKEK